MNLLKPYLGNLDPGLRSPTTGAERRAPTTARCARARARARARACARAPTCACACVRARACACAAPRAPPHPCSSLGLIGVRRSVWYTPPPPLLQARRCEQRQPIRPRSRTPRAQQSEHTCDLCDRELATPRYTCRRQATRCVPLCSERPTHARRAPLVPSQPPLTPLPPLPPPHRSRCVRQVEPKQLLGTQQQPCTNIAVCV